MYKLSNGVRFADTAGTSKIGKHSYSYFGAILASKVIGSPDLYTFNAEVPGRDGMLDLTEGFYNNVYFKNRTLQLQFLVPDVGEKWAAVYSKFANELHGKKKYFMFDDDKDFYWYGRLSINQFTSNKHKGIIAIDCDCEPYKMEYSLHDATTFINGIEVNAWKWDELSFISGMIYPNVLLVGDNSTVTMPNRHKKVKPQLKSNCDMDITFDGITYSLTGDNAWHTATFYLNEGDNSLSIKLKGSTFTPTGEESLYCRFRGGSL